MPETVRSYILSTIRSLFARSGNCCCYTGCTELLIEDDDLLVGEICHIHAAHPGGPRFDGTKSPQYLRSSANLILMCGKHHKRVDTFEDAYPVARLQRMKREHESRYRGGPEFPESVLKALEKRIEADADFATILLYPELKILTKMLRQWGWEEREKPKEAILDTAAYIAFMTVDGSSQVFTRGGDPAAISRDSGSIRERFWQWAENAREQIGEDSSKAATSEVRLDRYRKLISGILDRLRQGTTPG